MERLTYDRCEMVAVANRAKVADKGRHNGDRRRSPIMTQVPSFSDAGPLSVDSVHRPSRPSHARNVFHFTKGLWSEEERLFPPFPLLFNLVFVL